MTQDRWKYKRRARHAQFVCNDSALGPSMCNAGCIWSGCSRKAVGQTHKLQSRDLARSSVTSHGPFARQCVREGLNEHCMNNRHGVQQTLWLHAVSGPHAALRGQTWGWANAQRRRTCSNKVTPMKTA